MKRWNLVVMLGGTVASVGCGDGSFAAQEADAQASRRLLLCRQGLGDRSSGSDRGLFEICEGFAHAGFEVVRDEEGFPAFAATHGQSAYEALIDELDENGDGVVDDDDTWAAIHLIGFSWGGIGVAAMADSLRDDDRVAFSQKVVMGMVMFDPYRPLTKLTVPDNVANAWVYRQSQTTPGDCSAQPLVGGFNGRVPHVEVDFNDCAHYDLDAFLDGVGHCDVPRAAADAAFTNITTHEDYAPWDEHAQACLPQ